jgi:hypothetical protein
MAKKRGKRNDSEDGKHKHERVSSGHNPRRAQNDRHKYQHPEQPGMLNFP